MVRKGEIVSAQALGMGGAAEAVFKMGLGNRIAALNDARTAVNMAPDEPAFRELLAQLNAGSRAYGQRGTQGGFGSYLCANPCLTLCLANMLCNCCCLGGRGGFYYC